MYSQIHTLVHYRGSRILLEGVLYALDPLLPGSIKAQM
jgi:hypothetical protein